MNKTYLALFDLDGTLFNTDDVNYHAYKDALSKYGYDLDREYFVTKCNGRHYKTFLPEIMGDTKHMEDVHEAKKKAYAGHLDKAKVNEHLFRMIDDMKTDYHISLVTTASKANSNEILRFYGYEDFFEYMITQEDLTKMKPDPEAFILAMDHFIGIFAAGLVYIALPVAIIAGLIALVAGKTSVA